DLSVGQDGALLRTPLGKVHDDGPNAGANRALGDGLESRELPDGRIAGHELIEARVERPAIGQVKVPRKLGSGGASDPDERKENWPVRQAPTGLDQHDALKLHEGLTVAAL